MKLLFLIFLEFKETLLNSKLFFLYRDLVDVIGCETLSELRDPETWGIDENDFKEQMGP